MYRPQLEYAVEVWSGCTKADTEKLEKVYNRVGYSIK